MTTQPKPCADCAYRGGSPERRGDPGYNGDEDDLNDLVVRGGPFWCHQGIRKPVFLRHPSGVMISGHPAAYDPPVVDARPYRADGHPRCSVQAGRCAGCAYLCSSCEYLAGDNIFAAEIAIQP